MISVLQVKAAAAGVNLQEVREVQEVLWDPSYPGNQKGVN